MIRTSAIACALAAAILAASIWHGSASIAHASAALQATAGDQAPAIQNAPAKPANQETAKPDAAAGAKDRGETSQQNPGNTDARPRTWADDFAKLTKAIQELFAGLLGAVSWALAALMIVIILRKQLVDLLEGLVSAMRDRGVSFDVGTFVKVQVAERAPDGTDELRPVYSPSPFDLDDDSGDGSTVLDKVPPQQNVQMSDYVARQWALQPGNTDAVDKMHDDRAAFEKACNSEAADFDTVRGHLINYARSLEAVRFLEARELAQLLRKHQVVLNGVKRLRPTDLLAQMDELFVLHAAGAGFAHVGDSGTAFELLDRVTWKDDQPFFIPAASMWLIPRYHSWLANLADTRPDASFESDDVLKEVTEIIERGERLVDAVDRQTWSDLKSVSSPKGYYVREAHKAVGDVASIVADLVSKREMRRGFLVTAEQHLQRCAKEIEGEAPSPLDHNNLADLYRQLGDLSLKIDGNHAVAKNYYHLAHEQMRSAFAAKRPADPAFHHTRALLLFSQRDLTEARRALAEYTSDDARRGDDLDLEQYFDNQALAAKLAFIQSPPPEDGYGLATAQTILEAAERFLASVRTRLECLADRACNVEAQLRELSAFAYLQSSRGEGRAVAAFDRLFTLPDWKPTPMVALRARTGRANALGLSARLERHRLSRMQAARLRDRAAKDIVEVLATLKKFPIDASVGDERRQRNAGLWLDGVRAAQLLAEEHFAGSDAKLAQEMADQVVDLLPGLRTALETRGAPSNGDPGSRKALRRVAARRALLGARLLVHEDPSFQKEDTITKVEAALTDVYGVSAHYDCQADLERGSALLTSAFLRKGDFQKDYLAAVAAFEHAVERDAPALRGHAVRALARAYALRALIVRSSKSSTEK